MWPCLLPKIPMPHAGCERRCAGLMNLHDRPFLAKQKGNVKPSGASLNGLSHLLFPSEFSPAKVGGDLRKPKKIPWSKPIKESLVSWRLPFHSWVNSHFIRFVLCWSIHLIYSIFSANPSPPPHRFVEIQRGKDG